MAVHCPQPDGEQPCIWDTKRRRSPVSAQGPRVFHQVATVLGPQFAARTRRQLLGHSAGARGLGCWCEGEDVDAKTCWALR